MRKEISVVTLLVILGLFAISNNRNSTVNSLPLDTIATHNVVNNEISEIEKLYHEVGLSGILKFEAFEMAMNGFDNLSFPNQEIVSIIDFTLPSTDKRMCVVDLKNKKVLFHTIVAHGRNSGEKYATSFSNKHGSFQSSLGFYRTENTYQGGNGYSLVLEGLEKGINDQARPRAVVIHGADYASQNVIKSTGRLGRSYGCPALPREVNKPIINTIKNGTMLFIYADNKDYLAKTKILKAKKSNTMLAESPNVKENNSRLN